MRRSSHTTNFEIGICGIRARLGTFQLATFGDKVVEATLKEGDLSGGKGEVGFWVSLELLAHSLSLSLCTRMAACAPRIVSSQPENCVASQACCTLLISARMGRTSCSIDQGLPVLRSSSSLCSFNFRGGRI